MKPSEINKIEKELQAASEQTKARVCRETLDDIRRMLDEMDQRHAEEVHHLFMDNYIDFSDYEFRDDWMMDAYHECFHEYYNDEVVVDALMNFPLEIADIIKAGDYEDAAANLYYLFDYMAALEKKHEPWFKSLWTGGEMSKIACYFDTICELYCYLRQMKEVPNSLKDEMDIHLRIFNRKTYFFGDMWGNSRFEDLVLDGKEQFNDYSVLEECSMWKHWYLKNYGKLPSQDLLN